MKGETLTLQIDALSNSGDGVGRHEGLVVFVPFTCPGDVVQVTVTEKKKSFLKAKLTKIIEASKERVEAPCPYYGNCGGCQWQHVSYQTQLQWKEQNLLQSLKRLGQLDCEDKFHGLVGSPKEYHYRNRIQVISEQGAYHYNAKSSKNKVPVEECLLADARINEVLKKPTGQKGKVEIAVRKDASPEFFPVNEVGQSEMGFRQVNSAVNELILEQISKWAQKLGVRKVADLYCGQGNWSHGLSPRLADAEFWGVDINPTSIQAAQAIQNPKTHFHCGPAESLFSWSEIAQDFDLIIIDPPRAGCSDQTIQLLNQTKGQHLVYVSCHPATLARDLKALTENTWSVSSVMGFDMFPQTPHLESLVLLQGAYC